MTGPVPRRRVLVVDDDRQMVETMGDILRIRGWNADGVFSGEDAITAVRRESYDVVIMDIKMGGIDGVTTLRRIREEQPGLPVLLMTAYASRELIVAAENDGAVRVLPKPVEPTVLLKTLDLAVSRDSNP